tara:strand:+ start:246 stop:452 length:207 start_codon:yes stop_codon:yes gene_type:complete
VEQGEDVNPVLLQTTVEDAEWHAKKKRKKEKRSEVLVENGSDQHYRYSSTDKYLNIVLSFCILPLTSH